MHARHAHEQVELTPAELEGFNHVADMFEVHQEHVLDPSLMFYVN